MLGPGFDAILDRAQRGDESSFSGLYRDLQPPLLRYLRAAVGGAAEDVASDAWVCVARDLPRFRGDEAGFRRWVFTIARHRVLDWRRVRARTPTSAGPVDHWGDVQSDDDPADQAIGQLSADAALRLVATLPREEAEVVILRAVAGLDVATVARLVGKRPGTVQAIARRGLHRLAALLVDAPAPA